MVGRGPKSYGESSITSSALRGGVYYGPRRGEDLTMPDEQLTASVDRELVRRIVAAYVRRNQIGSDQLPALIATVYQALGRLGKQLAEPAGERTPAVPIRRSVHHDYVVGVECGEGKRCGGTSLVMASASSSIAFDGTCRATTPRSLRPIARVAPRWPSSLGSVSAVGDREQHDRKPRHRQDDRGDRERREVDRSRRA